MNELTEKDLILMVPGKLFASETGIYPDLASRQIRWVAARGKGMHDWAMYYGRISQSIEHIARYGDKIFDKDLIQKMVPCTKKAYALYRF